MAMNDNMYVQQTNNNGLNEDNVDAYVKHDAQDKYLFNEEDEYVKRDEVEYVLHDTVNHGKSNKMTNYGFPSAWKPV